MRRNLADSLYKIVYQRFKEEQPKREMTCDELSSIWYTIYEKLCKGETEYEVKKWCQTTPLTNILFN